MRWAGIDEAGYGPNLGPLVMTAVLAEGPDGPPPDVWSDLGSAVTRAGGPREALWVDDSKRLYRGGQGRDRLEAAALAVVSASRPTPATFGELLATLGAGTLVEAELDLWLPADADPSLPSAPVREFVDRTLGRRPLAGARWQIVGVRSVVMGPARFNALLAAQGSKAHAHFAAFRELLRWLWDGTAPGASTRIRGDKHGGRHYYLGPLSNALPEAHIEAEAEGPDLSAYVVRGSERRLDLELCPRADADDGLVALASLVSKATREWWMSTFNDHWGARVPGLQPTAGYPGDASRFRLRIEPFCIERGLATDQWWRAR